MSYFVYRKEDRSKKPGFRSQNEKKEMLLRATAGSVAISLVSEKLEAQSAKP